MQCNMNMHNVIFENNFGSSISNENLLLLYKLINDKGGAPIVINLHTGDVIEIQYLNSVDDRKNYDMDSLWFCLGVNYDGDTLLLDFSRDEVPLMQCEFGEIDYLNIILQNLIDALQ